MLMRILILHSTFDCLYETVCVARPASSLIAQVASEIKVADIPQVEFLGDFVVGNMIRGFVPFHEVLGLRSSVDEVVCLFAELFRARQRVFDKFLLFFFLVQVQSLHRRLESCIGYM